MQHPPTEKKHAWPGNDTKAEPPIPRLKFSLGEPLFVPSREPTHIPPGEKEHIQKCLSRGYVSS